MFYILLQRIEFVLFSMNANAYKPQIIVERVACCNNNECKWYSSLSEECSVMRAMQKSQIHHEEKFLKF